ncbi:isochorismatase family protein [Nonomuraea zeae]|uniref:Isochorismatase family protein n=2 Tax=Nonomuraea zeae TaxID=1642303 RepID=A0A5S4G5Q3_9ACTN|nr:isochorismatase family protein [Nonomuraea zeae]
MRAYFEPGADLYVGSRDCLLAAARVLAAARTAGVPVIHTRVSHSRDGIDGGLFYRKAPPLRHLNGPLGEVMPEVTPAANEIVIVKQYASAFFGTTLASTLTALRVDTLVITGVSTSGCVRASAVDAVQHGFVPIVVRQAVGDRSPAPHAASLYDIQAKYGEVWEEHAVLERLSAPAAEGPRTP